MLFVGWCLLVDHQQMLCVDGSSTSTLGRVQISVFFFNSDSLSLIDATGSQFVGSWFVGM